MPQIEDRWPKVKRILAKFHIADHHIVAIQTMRVALIEEASRGTPHLSDYTLHNADHSDNLIFLLNQLRTNFRLNLSPYEAYLLSAGIYLHDVGMYTGAAHFEEEILPNWQELLPLCPHNKCDHPGLYNVEERPVGDQIRELHNLLSAYRLLEAGSTYGLATDDIPYVVQLTRAHRRVDLFASTCQCLRTDLLDDQTIRVALLASLVRLLDAMDFARNRAPERVFQIAALDFLRNPTALEHWIKHYFAKSSEVRQMVKSSEPWLICTAHFAVPHGQLNGRPYRAFFEPLIAAHVDNTNRSDLNMRNYPAAYLHEALGIKDMHLEYTIREQVGFKTLPPEVVSSIEESRAQDALEFIQWLKQPSHPIAPVTREIPKQKPDMPRTNGRHRRILRVLFLEDEPQLVKTLPIVLESKFSRLQVVGLTDITEALARIAEEKFDVVLLDIAMPPTKDMVREEIEYGRLTGIVIARRIKRVKPDMPIVALTVLKDPAAEREIRNSGVCAVIHKPADIEDIGQTLLGTTADAESLVDSERGIGKEPDSHEPRAEILLGQATAARLDIWSPNEHWGSGQDGVSVTRSMFGGLCIIGTMWQNYRFSFEFKIVNKCAGWIVRGKSCDHHIMIQCNDRQQLRSHIRAILDEGDVPRYKVIKEIPLRYSLDEWNEARTMVIGNSIEIRIGGLLVWSDSDLLMDFPSGTVGFRCADDEKAVFRNIQVVRI